MPKGVPVNPNDGLRVAYQRKLERAVDEMTRSVGYWLAVEYRKQAPAIAQDASPTMVLAAAMRKLARRWLRNFDTLSDELAEWFATSAAQRVDSTLKDMMRRGGFTVRLKLTRSERNVLQATVQENVTLIKSIATRYLSNVEGAVMRSVAAGRDLGTLTKELEQQAGVTRRRAAFIARDQNNKATAMLAKVRQLELYGPDATATWLHSAGGRVPRPEHVAFSGKTYKVATGAFLEGKWVWPGSEPGCRCVSIPNVPGFD